MGAKNNKTTIEIYEKYLSNLNLENYVKIDNNIFSELDCIENDDRFKTKPHKAFTFSYLWLVSYLWKTCEYGNNLITVENIKEMLGLNPRDSKLDYIIKKSGLLDTEGYTETVRNFPVSISNGEKGIKLFMKDDLCDDIKNEYNKSYGNRFTCKKPIQQHDRNEKEGLLFSREDCIQLTLLEFTRTMSIAGYEGFFTYAYLKYRSKMIGYGYVRMFAKELSSATGFSERKNRETIKSLVESNIILKKEEIKHIQGKISKNNSYSINEHFRK